MNSDLTIECLLCSFVISSSFTDPLDSARSKHGGEATQTSKHFCYVMDVLSDGE